MRDGCAATRVSSRVVKAAASAVTSSATPPSRGRFIRGISSACGSPSPSEIRPAPFRPYRSPAAGRAARSLATPVPLLVAVTVTPGSTAPLGSVTHPEMPPRKVWAALFSLEPKDLAVQPAPRVVVRDEEVVRHLRYVAQHVGIDRVSLVQIQSQSGQVLQPQVLVVI